MKIQDYIDILNFILDQGDCKLGEGTTIEFVIMLLEVPINHNKIKEFLLDVATDTDF